MLNPCNSEPRIPNSVRRIPNSVRRIPNSVRRILNSEPCISHHLQAIIDRTTTAQKYVQALAKTSFPGKVDFQKMVATSIIREQAKADLLDNQRIAAEVEAKALAEAQAKALSSRRSWGF